MKIKVVVLTVISLLAMHLSTMPAHAADHANAYGFTNWNPNRISLSESQSIEQEFTVLAASGIKEGQTFRWTNQYHLHFCWKSQISDSANKPCGLFGFSLGGMSGGSYTGNLEFNLFTSTEFKITDSNAYCRNFSDSVKIQGVQTFNYTCWRGVTIKPGVKYILRLESFSVLGSNYWQTSLTNTANGTVQKLGNLKAVFNDTTVPLTSLSTKTNYIGDPVACSSVPISDTSFSIPKDSSGNSPSFGSYVKGNCVNTTLHLNSSTSTYTARLGGADPKSRDPNKSVGALRIPRSDDSWSRPAGLLPGLVMVQAKGYFADKTTFFKDDPTNVTRYSRVENELPSWTLDNKIGTNISIWWSGYFIPDENGYWQFNLTSDDSALMWIGNNAVANYANGVSTAFINNSGTHPAQSKSNSLYLEKNKVYPIRIQYGNSIDVGTFALEVKSPSFTEEWDTNLTGLIWSSDFSDRTDCTNYGISYTLSAKLGYDIIDVPGCLNNPAVVFNTKPKVEIPEAPTLKSISVSNGTLNITVNLGGVDPDTVYIVSPTLGNPLGSKVLGDISGKVASWKIKLDNTLLGTLANFSIVSSLKGNESEPFKSSFKIPSPSPTPTTTSRPVPKVTSKPKVVPQTVKCVRGSIIRTFTAKTCPPGYRKG